MACSVCAAHGTVLGYTWILQLVIFIVFFAVVWWLIRNNKLESGQTSEEPIDILKRRLASGEIGKKEFESLRKEIE